MNDREAFMQMIIANPEDDVPRLVMADWFADRANDPDRGDFIRTQIEMETLNNYRKTRFTIGTSHFESRNDKRPVRWSGRVASGLFRNGSVTILEPIKAYTQAHPPLAAFCKITKIRSGYSYDKEEQIDATILALQGEGDWIQNYTRRFDLFEKQEDLLRNNQHKWEEEDQEPYNLWPFCMSNHFEFSYVRGFIGEISCNLDYWIQEGKKLCKLVPICTVKIPYKRPGINSSHQNFCCWQADDGETRSPDGIPSCLMDLLSCSNRAGYYRFYPSVREALDDFQQACLKYGRRKE